MDKPCLHERRPIGSHSGLSGQSGPSGRDYAALLGLLLSFAIGSNAMAAKASAPAAKSSAPAATAPTAGATSNVGPAASAATVKTNVSSLSRSKKAYDELAFEVREESFLNREKPPAGVPDYTQIGAHFRTETDGRTFRGTLELGGSFSTSVENYTNLYVPEGFLDWQTGSWQEGEVTGDLRARVSVGRRLEAWSLLDRSWDLGLWEPLNRFDALRPIDQGLTGFFIDAGYGDAKVTLFLSSLYIPEQGANFTLQNGRVQSSNPWFVEPSDRLILFQESTSIRYDIQTPSAGSVINHASAGVLLRYGELEKGGYAQASYIFKPRNQLAIPFEASLDLTDTTSFASVSVHPEVVYHQLIGFESGYAGETFTAGLSALADFPINNEPGPNLTYQELDPLMLVSPHVDGRFDLGAASDLSLGVSYLASTGGGVATRGRFASEKGVFGPRVPWGQAVAVDGRLVFGHGHRRTWSFGGRWLEELAEQGSLLTADAACDFALKGAATQDWRVSLSADVLGSRRASNDNQGYISQYRGNDRLMSQLRFVF